MFAALGCKNCGKRVVKQGLCYRCLRESEGLPDRRRKLTDEDVELMRQLRADMGHTYRELAEMFGVSISNVSHVIKGRSRTG